MSFSGAPRVLVRITRWTSPVPTEVEPVAEPSRLRFKSNRLRESLLGSIRNSDLQLSPLTLTTEEKLALTASAELSDSEIYAITAEKITFDDVLRFNARLPHLRRAGINMQRLRAMGATMAALRDAEIVTPADLVLDQSLAEDVINVFADDTLAREAFLRDGADAVLLAASAAAVIMQFDVDALLTACASDKRSAIAVLQQYPRDRALRGVRCVTLINCQVFSGDLAAMGFAAEHIANNVTSEAPGERNAVFHALY